MMSVTLTNVIEIITIMSFVAGIMNFTIIKPLQKSIDDLSTSLKALDYIINNIKEREIILEESVKSAHKRIDKLEENR